MPAFIPGLELCRMFYQQVVEPIVTSDFPGLRYAAALIGPGSEALGFDTEMSTDHHWGPRAMLFLSETDHSRHADAIVQTLRRKLPYTFMGYSTSFTPPDPQDHGTQLLEVVGSGPVNHRVEVLTLRGFFGDYVGIDPFSGLQAADWLTLPGQRLRTATAGAVFRDDTGDLGRIRQQLDYYPRDVWLYMLAAGWTRIAQEEHFVGRAGIVGDELGSRLITSRLVHDLMNLCFLMDRQYAPYSKWFGTAFARLGCAPRLISLFHAALSAENWQDREHPLCQAFEIVAELHNRLNLTERLDTHVRPFFGRPFKVLFAGRFADAIAAQIQDAEVRRVLAHTMIGAVEQFSTSTDVLECPAIFRSIQHIY